MRKLHFIKSLDRGLSVLETFSKGHAVLTLTEIAIATGLNVVASQRYTDTLLQLGYLKRDKHKRFYLSPKTLSLGFSFLDGSQIRRISQNYLTEFSEKINKTVNLSILENTEIIFLFRKEARSFLKHDLHAGSKLPAYCSGAGKVLLSALEDAELRKRIKKMKIEKMTRHTLIDKKKLWTDLMKTRERGYAIVDRELSLSMFSIAAPILDRDGITIAAVNISLSAEEAKKVIIREMIKELLKAGRELSTYMGYYGQYPLIVGKNESTQSHF